MTTLMTPLPGPAPTHRCTTCGALWRYWPRRDTGFDEDSWSLRTKHGGPCCSGASEPMRGQIVPLTLDDLRTAIEAAEKAEPVAWMMVNPTTLPGHRSLHWKPQTDWHITWESVPLYAAPQTPQPARNPWRDAMDDELVCLHLGTTETFPEPREALRQIIDWHVEIALDPAVSSRAAELQSRGPERKPGSWAQEIIDDLLGLHDSELICEEDSGDALIRLDAAICVVEEAGKRWPARTPMTEEDIDSRASREVDLLLDHIYEHGTLAEGVQQRIRDIVRAIERHHGIRGPR